MTYQLKGGDLLVFLPNGRDALLTIDAPSPIEESLFSLERDEFVDALLLADGPERIETLQRLLGARFCAAIGVPRDADESNRTAAAEFMAVIADRFDGMLQLDGVGFVFDGQFRLQLSDY